jgi:hypothetical protein
VRRIDITREQHQMNLLKFLRHHNFPKFSSDSRHGFVERILVQWDRDLTLTTDLSDGSKGVLRVVMVGCQLPHSLPGSRFRSIITNRIK